jgi:hypothetical protein
MPFFTEVRGIAQEEEAPLTEGPQPLPHIRRRSREEHLPKIWVNIVGWRLVGHFKEAIDEQIGF